ncbi:O-antigen polymerase [Roseivirga echinicomitans]
MLNSVVYSKSIDQSITLSYSTRLFIVFIICLFFIWVTIPNHFTEYDQIVLTISYLPTILLLLLQLNSNKSNGLSGLDPVNISVYSFFIFHIVFNNVVFSNEYLIYQRGWNIENNDLMKSFILKYNTILFLAVMFFFVGSAIRIDNLRRFVSVFIAKVTFTPRLLMLLGVFFVAIGILGNILLIGSVGAYISKLSTFYAHSDVYNESVREVGSGLVLKKILQSFFIPGILLILWSFKHKSNFLFFVRLLCLVIFTMFFNGTSGQRSQILNPLIFVGISYVIFVNKMNPFKVGFFGAMFFIVAISIGYVRNQVGLGREFDFNLLFGNLGFISSIFASQYLTNFSGALTLLDIIHVDGFLRVDTVWSSFTGLLGGPTPTTTEAYVWQYLTGDPFGSNPRYGLFIELYANYGYIGLVLMTLPGLCTKGLAKIYRSFIERDSVTVKIIVPFLILMAVLMVNGNASYFGRQLAYMSWPFYLLFFLQKS